MLPRVAALWASLRVLRYVHFACYDCRGTVLHPRVPFRVRRWLGLPLRTTLLCGAVTCPQCQGLLEQHLGSHDDD